MKKKKIINKLKIIKNYRPIIKELDKLWANCIKARAGYKSEISGKIGALHGHHLRGKPNHAMRYSLDNGICITAGEHFFGFHNEGRKQDYEKKVKALRGDDVFEKLELLRSFRGKTDLFGVKAYLEAKLKEYEQILDNKEF